MNVGYLVAGRPAPRSCTPAGIIEMLKHYRIPMAGRHAVVLGRSDIVGKPMALMLLHENATVTICHSRTVNLPEMCRQADILVAAIGRAAFVTADFIQPGATVVDVGINRITDPAEAARLGRSEEFAAQGQSRSGRRPSARRSARGGRLHAGAGRRGAADHRHADVQHGGLGGAASGRRIAHVAGRPHRRISQRQELCRPRAGGSGMPADPSG